MDSLLYQFRFESPELSSSKESNLAPPAGPRCRSAPAVPTHRPAAATAPAAAASTPPVPSLLRRRTDVGLEWDSRQQTLNSPHGLPASLRPALHKPPPYPLRTRGARDKNPRRRRFRWSGIRQRTVTRSSSLHRRASAQPPKAAEVQPAEVPAAPSARFPSRRSQLCREAVELSQEMRSITITTGTVVS